MLRTETAADLSFGVELKFLIPCVLKGTTCFAQFPLRPILRLDEDMRLVDVERLIHSKVVDTINEHSAQEAVAQYQIQEDNRKEKEFWASHWIVKKSQSPKPADGDQRYDGYHWVPVEVNSPSLAWTDPDSLPKVQEVILAITKNHRIVSNHTCEAHIHVGRLDGEAPSLSTLKKLGILFWLAEPILRGVKDPKSPNFHHKYTWSSPLRQHTRLAKSLADSFDPHADGDLHVFDDAANLEEAMNRWNIKSCKEHEAARSIWRTRSHTELATLLTGIGRQYRRPGFNFSAFGEGIGVEWDVPKTVEVRFLEGIMESTMITGWIATIATMVEVSLEAQQQDPRFRKATRRLAQSGSWSTLSLHEAFQGLCKDLQIPLQHSTPVAKKIQQNYAAKRSENQLPKSLWPLDEDGTLGPKSLP
ncbi:hypothetical protein F4780DRAFT_329093 [Xylariomycetidae sp. FL0641]|nr:hypothetical protein F4780DRAFT_329093 [Xylariomycetidae sp. FL0641]